MPEPIGRAVPIPVVTGPTKSPLANQLIARAIEHGAVELPWDGRDPYRAYRTLRRVLGRQKHRLRTKLDRDVDPPIVILWAWLDPTIKPNDFASRARQRRRPANPE